MVSFINAAIGFADDLNSDGNVYDAETNDNEKINEGPYLDYDQDYDEDDDFYYDEDDIYEDEDDIYNDDDLMDDEENDVQNDTEQDNDDSVPNNGEESNKLSAQGKTGEDKSDGKKKLLKS
ncbi:hypothetical protein DRF75_04390 [Ehrlichia minasensis]|uniref:Uncharacterized protein n=2 Tax=Ehrlichia minasensis TaxID=1242993 RepID=A0A4Q6I3I4_9RICK|nr:hypothetical protein DRF75_04390 [Ehrlichia minasensis]